MSRKRTPVASQGDVHEFLLLPQVLEGGEYGGMEVVPSQRVLLLWGGLGPHRALRRCNLYANDYAVFYPTVVLARTDRQRSLRWKFCYLSRIDGGIGGVVVVLVENFGGF